MTDGLFVAFEGLDGAGTTTQAERTAEYVDAETGRTSALSAEPTDGPVGTQIRRCLEGEIDFDAETLALLFAADRLDHIDRDIEPSLAAGDVVLVDRYSLSSFAYQHADGVDGDWLRSINDRARSPDVTFYLDVPPAVCIERLADDGGGTDRFEHAETLERVEAAYERAIAAERDAGNDVRVIDGTRSVSAVSDDIAAVVDELL
ncbi:dTMP kinase [Salinarchaeum laminariae]|uniref:dTMP kinase n=1 Tax=Salinarchaeum laminariae TaxID=869888 RepID=UPI0020BF36BB|nr:dTMP kinase [Salinarchaeum laminariae]